MNRVQPLLVVTLLLVATVGCSIAASTGTALPTGGPTVPAAPSTALGSADVGRSLAAGTYQVGDPFGVPTTIQVPGGWKTTTLDQGDIYLSSADAWIAIELLENVFADPCHQPGGPMDPPSRRPSMGSLRRPEGDGRLQDRSSNRCRRRRARRAKHST